MFAFIRGFITAPRQPPAQTVTQFHTESSLTAPISGWRRRRRFVLETAEGFVGVRLWRGAGGWFEKFGCTSHTSSPRTGCVTAMCVLTAGRSSPLLLLWRLGGGGGGGGRVIERPWGRSCAAGVGLYFCSRSVGVICGSGCSFADSSDGNKNLKKKRHLRGEDQTLLFFLLQLAVSEYFRMRWPSRSSSVNAVSPPSPLPLSAG